MFKYLIIIVSLLNLGCQSLQSVERRVEMLEWTMKSMQIRMNGIHNHDSTVTRR